MGAVGYVHMPDMIPMHMGFDGTVNDWAEKTPLILWMPVLIQGFMAACFVFSHWTIARSKKWAEPGAPATSALAYGLFARAQSIYLVAGGVVIAVAMIAMPLSFMNVIDLGQAAVFIMIAAIVLCVGAMAISLVYGQAGSRVFKNMQTSDRLHVDDDRYWKDVYKRQLPVRGAARRQRRRLPGDQAVGAYASLPCGRGRLSSCRRAGPPAA